MTTTATPGAVTSLLGQQSQGGSAQAQNFDPQGFMSFITKALPIVVRAAQEMLTQQSASPLGLQPQQQQQQYGYQPQQQQQYGYQPYQPQQYGFGGVQQQNVDPAGLFDFVTKNLPVIVKAVTDVVSTFSTQSTTPQGLQPQGQQQQDLDPQFLQFLIPAIPGIISAVSSILRPQQFGPQQFGPQQFGGGQQQGGQQQNVDPQFLLGLIKQVLPPQVRQVLDQIMPSQLGPQSIFPQQPYPWSSGYTGWPFQPRPSMQMSN